MFQDLVRVRLHSVLATRGPGARSQPPTTTPARRVRRGKTFVDFLRVATARPSSPPHSPPHPIMPVWLVRG